MVFSALNSSWFCILLSAHFCCCCCFFVCLFVCLVSACLHFSLVFCLRSDQAQTKQTTTAPLYPVSMCQFVQLSICLFCLFVCLSVCLSQTDCLFVCFVWAQLEHKLAGCSLPPACAPGFNPQTADRRRLPWHPIPPSYTCAALRTAWEYTSYASKFTVSSLSVMLNWAVQVSPPIFWLVIVRSLNAGGRREVVAGAHPELLYFPISPSHLTSFPASCPSRGSRRRRAFYNFAIVLRWVDVFQDWRAWEVINFRCGSISSTLFVGRSLFLNSHIVLIVWWILQTINWQALKIFILSSSFSHWNEQCSLVQSGLLGTWKHTVEKNSISDNSREYLVGSCLVQKML